MARGKAPSVAVVGSGLAGLAAALSLDEAGHAVRVFDKGRDPAGRLATRRTGGGTEAAAFEDAPYAFDHGAQYLTARDPDFLETLERLVAQGAAARWDGRFATLSPAGLVPESDPPARYVGVPGMNQIGRILAFDLDLVQGAEIAPPRRAADGRWDLGPHGTWDILLVTAPAPQAAALLADAPALAAAAAEARFAPCLAALAGFETPVDPGADGLFVEDPEGILAWAAANHAKPGRPAGVGALVLHATPDWSAAHRDDDVDRLKFTLYRRLREMATETLGLDLPERPALLRGHRWRYARAVATVATRFDPDAAAGFAGDWAPPDGVGTGRAEDAWRSGRALAEAVLAA